MSNHEQAREDLRFLREVVEGQERRFQLSVGPSVAIIWSTYVLVICVVNDRLVWEYTAAWARYVSWFGFLVSIAASVIAPRYDARRRGQAALVTSREVLQRLLPWVGCAMAVGLFLGMAETIGMFQRLWIAMILVALTAFHIGLAGSPVMLWLAIGSAAGMGTVLMIPALGWIGFAVPFYVCAVRGALLEERRARQ